MSVGRVDPREDRDHDRRDTATRGRAVTGRARGAPTAETKAFTYDDAVAEAGDEDDVAPAEAPDPGSSPQAAPGRRAPAAARRSGCRGTRARADRPAGIFIPKWVGLVAAAIVAALIFGGIGYAIGDSSDSGTDAEREQRVPERQRQRRPAAARWRPVPRWPAPERERERRDGNGNGNGNGGTTASNAGFLGVGVQTSTDPKGVEITDVADGSPAAKAGLQDGDVITAIDGNDVTSRRRCARPSRPSRVATRSASPTPATASRAPSR